MTESWHDATPAPPRNRRPNVDRPKRRDEGPERPGREGPRRVSDLDHGRQEPDGLPYAHLMSMGEVEERIIRAEEELVKLTETHMDLSERAAHAKADWMAHLSRVLVRLAHSGEKGASDTREAVARSEMDPITGLEGNDLYRTYKVLTETAGAQARAMRAVESRVNAWQSIAANLRSVAT